MTTIIDAEKDTFDEVALFGAMGYYIAVSRGGASSWNVKDLNKGMLWTG